jgi:hypothetical protein
MGEMLQLRTWLLDTDPQVWRRLLVDPRLTLEQLKPRRSIILAKHL